MLAAPTFAASGDEVVLTSKDGAVNVVGTLVGFDANAYTLRTTLGNIRIGASDVACEGGACPDLENVAADVKIAGSGAVGLGLMPLLMQGYGAYLDAEATLSETPKQTDVLANFVGDSGFGEELPSYLVSSTQSGDAFSTLLSNTAHLGMSSRRITEKEARALERAGAGDMIDPSQEHVIALDGVVMIVHPDNPVEALSVDQVRDIYAGRITNWSQVGGSDMAITFATRPEGSGARAVFQDRLMGAASIDGTKQVVAQDNEGMADLVNNDPGALGYVGFAFQRGAKPLSLINACGIATPSDEFSAKAEEYTLQRRLYLYNRSDSANETVRDFLAYATSEQADNVIRKAGFVDLGIRSRAQDLSSDRAQALLAVQSPKNEAALAKALVEEMQAYDRLSTTFRFLTGSTELDERGRVDMERLVHFLENQPKGTEIAMVGFTDSVGDFNYNTRLGAQRAETILAQMTERAPELADHLTLRSLGYGEVAPSACNTTAQGKAINRRVEVWIKTQA